MKTNNDDEILLLLDTYYFYLKYYKQELFNLEKHKPLIFKKEYLYKERVLKNNIRIYENKIKDYIDNNVNNGF